MQARVIAKKAEDILLPMSRRPETGVYFLRLAEYSEEMETLIWQVHEEARTAGVIIEGQITNPDERQIRYFTEMLGSDFRPDRDFIAGALKKWMPRMSSRNQAEFAAAMENQLLDMRRAGKSESILRNVYMKMMCWLYYRFERVMPAIGGDRVPKVLYEGSAITGHELTFLRTLGSMGADILLVECRGDAAYLKQDPDSKWSQKLTVPGGRSFPEDFSLKALRKKKAQQTRPAPAATRAGQAARAGQSAPQRAASVPRPGSQAPVSPAAHPAPLRPPAQSTHRIDIFTRVPAPGRKPCTNAWMKEASMEQILLPPAVRGEDGSLYYNAYLRMKGVRDRITYENDLYRMYQTLKTNGRAVLVIDGAVPVPDAAELTAIRRRNYRSAEEMVLDLAGNLPAASREELQRCMRWAFARTMTEAAEKETNLNRMTVWAVYLLCWVRRYQGDLYRGWRETDLPCLIKMGPCETEAEALYMRFMSLMPADVLILSPNLNQACTAGGDNLLEISGAESLPVMKFPTGAGSNRMRTLASRAEEELTGLLYTDSGMYRNQQFSQAETVTLSTTFDEMFILWDQELKYRPHFHTEAGQVTLPVIYAKVSGVEDGKEGPYWQKIRKLASAPDTLLIRQMPMVAPGTTNRFQSMAVEAVKHEKIRTEVIRSSRMYPFGLLREEMQNHIFEKLQQMLSQRLIRGTFQNGTEYTVVATVLNMKQEMIRLIQGFDFTKRNPKLVLIHTKDQPASLEDAILTVFLSKIGFDVVLFVPTGYQTTEQYLNDYLPVEHQIGGYMYDLTVPDFDSMPREKGPSWLHQLIRRGN